MKARYLSDWNIMTTQDQDLIVQVEPRLNEFEAGVNEYFLAKQWHSHTCAKCQSLFYTKRREHSVCAKCTSPLEFLQYPRRKQPLKHLDLRKQTRGILGSKGYSGLKPLPMVPAVGNTLFTVAGVQAFNSHIFAGEALDTTAGLVMQPSIRLQGMNDTTQYPGCTTAFVNTVTLEAKASLDKHLQHIDTWLEYLAAIGLNVKDLRASLRFQIQNWGLGNCVNCNVDIAYGGLDIFNASFFQQMPTITGTPIDISDMGITIERTLWTLNKTASYFDAIGPQELSIRGLYIVLDALRTMVLMFGSGVDPKSKNGPSRMRAQKARSFAKKSAVLGQDINISTVVDYFYDYWSSYLDLPIDRKEVKEMVQSEFGRAKNVQIAEALGRPTNTAHVDVSTEEYIEFLLNNGVRRKQLAELLSDRKSG